jgi:glycosyltransferase EpsD
VKHRFKAGRIERVHGVGIDIEKFKPSKEETKQDLRQKNGYKSDDFLMFYAAEFNKNKNQQLLIRVLAKLKKTVPHARLILVGNGSMIDYCSELAKELGVTDMVDFLGFRKDIDEILPMCDLAVASSFREGLPVNIMEAMACGLPVIASDNRGHRELVSNNESGWVISPKDLDSMFKKIEMLAKTKGLKNQLGYMGREKVESKYAINKILTEMSAIYRNFMD